jgi:KipI family sensor histidine kinase inhibitor
MRQDDGMRVRRAGPRALLIECSAPAEAQAWHAALWQRREQGELSAEEIVPGERTVLLDGVDPDRITLADYSPSAEAPVDNGRLVQIEAVFDGVDLPDVAALWKISVPAAVERLTETEFTVAFCGFAPGFAYLSGLADEWTIPRLAAPRPKVPAGAVAVAGTYAGIYPTASPGGWRLVGRTEQDLFDVRREPPALLTPGTRVRLTEAR